MYRKLNGRVIIVIVKVLILMEDSLAESMAKLLRARREEGWERRVEQCAEGGMWLQWLTGQDVVLDSKYLGWGAIHSLIDLSVAIDTGALLKSVTGIWSGVGDVLVSRLLESIN